MAFLIFYNVGLVGILEKNGLSSKVGGVGIKFSSSKNNILSLYFILRIIESVI
jgi:hypothetical protein